MADLNRRKRAAGGRHDLLTFGERRDGDDFKKLENGQGPRLNRTLVRIMKKALLNDYRIKMEEALIKQQRYDDFVNLIQNNSIDGLTIEEKFA